MNSEISSPNGLLSSRFSLFIDIDSVELFHNLRTGSPHISFRLRTIHINLDATGEREREQEGKVSSDV